MPTHQQSRTVLPAAGTKAATGASGWRVSHTRTAPSRPPVTISGAPRLCTCRPAVSGGLGGGRRLACNSVWKEAGGESCANSAHSRAVDEHSHRVLYKPILKLSAGSPPCSHRTHPPTHLPAKGIQGVDNPRVRLRAEGRLARALEVEYEQLAAKVPGRERPVGGGARPKAAALEPVRPLHLRQQLELGPLQLIYLCHREVRVQLGWLCRPVRTLAELAGLLQGLAWGSGCSSTKTVEAREGLAQQYACRCLACGAAGLAALPCTPVGSRCCGQRCPAPPAWRCRAPTCAGGGDGACSSRRGHASIARVARRWQQPQRARRPTPPRPAGLPPHRVSWMVWVRLRCRCSRIWGWDMVGALLAAPGGRLSGRSDQMLAALLLRGRLLCCRRLPRRWMGSS